MPPKQTDGNTKFDTATAASGESAFAFIPPPLPFEKIPVNPHRLNQFPESERIGAVTHTALCF
jgi:hypothetical protein